ncbi:MAG: response regulator transcription factor [bacterium]
MSKTDQSFIHDTLSHQYHLQHYDRHFFSHSTPPFSARIFLIGDCYTLSDTSALILAIQDSQPFCEFIYCSQHPDVQTVVALCKLGLFDSLTIPTFASELTWVIEKAYDYHKLSQQILDHCSTEKKKLQYQHQFRQFKQGGDLVEHSSLQHYLFDKTVLRPGHKSTLLLVEDDLLIRQGLKHSLAPFFTILEAADGATALALAKHHTCHVALLDLGLPDMSGEDVLLNLRSLYPHIDILVVSAFRDIELVTRSIKSGACDYLVKDCDFSILKHKIIQRLQHYYFREALS